MAYGLGSKQSFYSRQRAQGLGVSLAWRGWVPLPQEWAGQGRGLGNHYFPGWGCLHPLLA